MRKSTVLALCAATLAAAGCALPLPGISPTLSTGTQQEVKTITTVQLTEGNYRIVKTDAQGTDWGINFLGVLPLVSADYTKAVAQLNRSAQIKPGNSQALINVLQQHTAPYFILFSIPRITFRADVVEFTAPAAARPAPALQQAPMP